jgi:hypothetical protein
MSSPKAIWVRREREKAEPRSLFLCALADCTPEVIRFLRDTVRPKYSNAFPAVAAKISHDAGPVRIDNLLGWFYGNEPSIKVLEDVPDILYWSNVGPLEQEYSAVTPLKDALVEWSHNFQLSDDWLLDAALQTLYRWQTDVYAWERDKKSDRLRFLLIGQSPSKTAPAAAPMRFASDPWRPSGESWQEYEVGLLEQFQRDLRRYRTEVERLYRSAKWRPALDIRQRQHYTWLAMFQVRGWSPAKIAETFAPEVEESTITKGVENAAKGAGLTLRPSNKGKGKRPRRRKT